MRMATKINIVYRKGGETEENNMAMIDQGIT